MLKELLTKKVDLHNISFARRTPFLDLLIGLSSPFYPDRGLPMFIIAIWLGDLEEGGIDLEAYGRREVELHRRGLVSWEWEGCDWSDWRDPNFRVTVTITWF